MHHIREMVTGLLGFSGVTVLYNTIKEWISKASATRLIKKANKKKKYNL